MVECDLKQQELEEMCILFNQINQSRKIVDAGLIAQEKNVFTNNELNSLDLANSNQGEKPCREELKLINDIGAAETAHLRMERCRDQLLFKLKSMGVKPLKKYAV